MANGIIKKAEYLLAGGIILLFMVSCAKKEKKPSGPAGSQGMTGRPMPKVEGYIVQTRSITENVEVPGTVIANEATEIHSEISGRVVYLNVKEGAQVGKGTVLARLYDGDLQAQLNKLQVQQKIAEQKEKRMEQLVKIGGISQQDYELGKLEVSNIKSDIEITRANISRTVVRAPFSGRLGLKNISPGAYVTPASIIATIQQTSQLKMDFTIPEKYSGKIKPGQVVSFSYQGEPGTFTAKVTATESSVTEATRSLMVRSLVLEKNTNLLPGGFAKVLLKFEPEPNAIMIPTQAILPQARGKRVILYRSGVAKFQEVTTGIRDSSTVQVTSGLTPGDTIVISGLLSVRPDAKIQLSKVSL